MKNGLRVQIEKELAKKFREEAMRRFGYGKGAISKAAEEAFLLWIKRGRKGGIMKVVREVAGCWKIKESGVEYVKRIREEHEERLKRLRIR